MLVKYLVWMLLTIILSFIAHNEKHFTLHLVNVKKTLNVYN